ncbi:MAG: hypothetical protein M3O89_09760 [Actinomycetota bacterium]|nr:hypothetical protein [Actinomycetota bacterium]
MVEFVQAGEHGDLRVQRVALAAAVARVRVRLVDLDQLDAARTEEAGERGRERPGRLDADPLDRAVRLDPIEQLAVASGRRRKLRVRQEPTGKVEHRHLMRVRVRVDASDDTCVTVRHAPPSLRSGATGPGRADTTVTRYL